MRLSPLEPLAAALRSGGRPPAGSRQTVRRRLRRVRRLRSVPEQKLRGPAALRLAALRSGGPAPARSRPAHPVNGASAGAGPHGRFRGRSFDGPWMNVVGRRALRGQVGLGGRRRLQVDGVDTLSAGARGFPAFGLARRLCRIPLALGLRPFGFRTRRLARRGCRGGGSRRGRPYDFVASNRQALESQRSQDG